jgi:hypothetical protein
MFTIHLPVNAHIGDLQLVERQRTTSPPRRPWVQLWRTPTNACERPINAAVFGFSSLFRRASAIRVGFHCIPLMDRTRNSDNSARVDYPSARERSHVLGYPAMAPAAATLITVRRP